LGHIDQNLKLDEGLQQKLELQFAYCFTVSCSNYPVSEVTRYSFTFVTQTLSNVLQIFSQTKNSRPLAVFDFVASGSAIWSTKIILHSFRYSSYLSRIRSCPRWV